MTDMEIVLTDLGETATRELARKYKPQGLEQNKTIARRGGAIAKNTRNNLEKELEEEIVTSKNSLNYKYIDNNKLLK